MFLCNLCSGFYSISTWSLFLLTIPAWSKFLPDPSSYLITIPSWSPFLLGRWPCLITVPAQLLILPEHSSCSTTFLKTDHFCLLLLFNHWSCCLISDPVLSGLISFLAWFLSCGLLLQSDLFWSLFLLDPSPDQWSYLNPRCLSLFSNLSDCCYCLVPVSAWSPILPKPVPAW